MTLITTNVSPFYGLHLPFSELENSFMFENTFEMVRNLSKYRNILPARQYKKFVKTNENLKENPPRNTKSQLG